MQQIRSKIQLIKRSRFYSKTSRLVETSFKDKVGIIQLNDVARMNAMTVEMGESFKKVVSVMREAADEQKIRACVIVGNGKAFSAGGDLEWLKARHYASVYENQLTMLDFYRRFLCLRTIPVPIIAAIHGPAIGAGLAISLACDWRIASEDARLGLTFPILGIHPGMGSSLLLPRLIGHQQASFMHLSGSIVSGTDALKSHLVLETTEGGENARENVLTRAMEMANQISNNAPIAGIK